MKRDITATLVNEHRLILRMIALLERNAPLTGEGRYTNWQFYLDGVDFIRNYLFVLYCPYRNLPFFA